MAGIVQTILGFMQQQEANRLAREEWDIKKEEATTKMKQQKMIIEPIEKAIGAGIITKDQASSILLDPKGLGATLWSLSQWNEPPKQPQSPPPSFDQTGEYGRPTNQMIAEQQKTLPQTIANQNLFGGMNSQDAMKDVLYKETGIGRSQEPIGSPRDIENPVTGQKQMGVVLKGGGFKWLTDPLGNPLVVPPDVDWRKTVVGNQVVEIGFDKKGNLIQQNGMPLIRANIPQEQQMLKGMSGPGGVPITMPVPPGGIPPQGLLEAVKGEPLEMTGPKGEVDKIFINPFTLKPITEQPGTPTGPQALPGNVPSPGIRTKPPQAQSVPVAQQTQMMKSGMEALKKIKDSIFDSKTGKINRTNLANAMVGTPWTEGKRVGNLIGAALNAIRLASTGAAFSKEELEQLKSQYIPSYTAKDDQIYDQWDMLGKFVNGMLEQMDPNEAYTKNQRTEFEKLMIVPRYKGGVNLQPGAKPSSKYQKLSNEDLLKQLEAR
jgi:hypothetical protein